MRRVDDAGISTIIGAIIVLGVMGIALVSINAYQVPRQGESIEVAAAERTDASLADLAAQLSAAPGGPIQHDVPLKLARTSPPLLAGLMLSPVRSDGRVLLDPDADVSRVSVSMLMAAPSEGVPAGDPTRVAEGGKMRVYVLGTATQGQPMGALHASTGGAHLPPSERVLEGGAVIIETQTGSALSTPPAIGVVAGSDATHVAWRIPILAGAPAEASGAGASVTLVPGPEGRAGGGQTADDVRIRLDTPRVAAWAMALEALVGTRGTVTTNGVVDDAGVVEVVVPDARLDLYIVRYDVSLADRAG